MELVIMYYSLNITTRLPLLKHQLLPNVHNEFSYYFTLISSGDNKECEVEIILLFVLIYIDNSKQGNAGSTDDNVVESVRDQEMKAATIGDA